MVSLVRSLAGALKYLTFTRSDISYDVQQICLYMHDPRDLHFTALKHILRYVRGTIDHGLQLHVSSTTQLTAYTDVDCAKAEYRGVANVAETAWLRNLLLELHVPLSTATLVYCDNVKHKMLSVTETVLDDEESSEDKYDDSFSFGCLPDEIVFEILNKLIDLKTLCLCKLVYIRFYAISNLVDTVSFTASTDECVCKSLKEFRRLKSLLIKLPPATKVVDPHFYKWKININKKFNTFVFLSADSVCDLQDAFPNDNNVSIKDSGKRARISLVELRNWICSDPQTANENINDAGPPCALSYCYYVPFLKFPACGYMMEGVCLRMWELGDDNDDTFTRFNMDDFEDREEAAYSEAVMKVLTEHRGRILRRMGPGVVE
ncbi:ribonuclease H-like domain-containing protein [Tanacetum coccineum]